MDLNFAGKLGFDMFERYKVFPCPNFRAVFYEYKFSEIAKLVIFCKYNLLRYLFSIL